MWDLFPREPSYPHCVHPMHHADLLASLGFPLVAENLHDTVCTGSRLSYVRDGRDMA